MLFPKSLIRDEGASILLNQIKKYYTLTSLEEAYRLTYGLKKIMLQRSFLVIFITFLISVPLLIINLYVLKHYNLSNFFYHTIKFAVKVVAVAIAIKLWVPMLIVGVRRSIGLPINLEEIKLACFMEKQNIYKLSFIYAVVTSVLASLLLLFPGYSVSEFAFRFGVYLLLSFLVTPITFFAFPLIITKKLTPIAALNSAYKNMYTNWATLAGPIILINVLFPSMIGCIILIQQHVSLLLGAILQIILFISVLWLIPMISTLGGILFRDTYGLTQRKTSTD